MKRFGFLVVLLLSIGFQARGETAFLACKNPTSDAGPVHERDLAAKLLEKKLLYLAKNKRVTEEIIACLDKSPDWQSPTPAGCQKFNYFLSQELLEKNFAFRMSQALSQRSMVMEPSRVQNLFDFEAQVDLQLSRSAGLGVLNGQQPLIQGEREYVYKAFVDFWRRFTQQYLDEMKTRLEEPRLSKYQKRELENRMSLLQKSLAGNDEEMLQRLAWSGDVNFNASAEHFYSEFRTNHRQAWMSYLEGMRVIAFVKKAEPSPQDLKTAFQYFLAYGAKTTAELTSKLNDHKRHIAHADAGELLAGDPMLSEEVMSENQGLCAFADSEFARYQRNEFIKTVFIGIPVSIGLLGVAFFAPPVISIPLMVAVDVYWISTSQIDVRAKRQLFYSSLTIRNQVGNLRDYEDAEGNAFLSNALAPLTLVAIHPSSLKNLVRSAKTLVR